MGEGRKKEREKFPRLAQAFSIQIAHVFEFCFIVADVIRSPLRRHHARYSWNLAVKIATFERSWVELHHRYLYQLNSLEHVGHL